MGNSFRVSPGSIFNALSYSKAFWTVHTFFQWLGLKFWEFAIFNGLKNFNWPFVYILLRIFVFSWNVMNDKLPPVIPITAFDCTYDPADTDLCGTRQRIPWWSETWWQSLLWTVHLILQIQTFVETDQDKWT